MNYVDYINIKLSNMSDSELQDFSEQCNFGLGSALFKGGKGLFKGFGTKQGAIRRAKQAFKSERNLDKYVENMWSGASLPVKGAGKSTKVATKSTKATNSISKVDNLPPTNAKVTPWPPKDTHTIAKSEPKAIETAVEPKEPFSHIYTGGGKATAESAEKAVTKEVASTETTAAKEVANTEKAAAEAAEKSAVKEAEEVASRFSSPAEAVAANKSIQELDKQIMKAVKDGNPKRAAELRKARSIKARGIERAYHKAYSGKLRNIHEWGRDHKAISGTLGAAGVLGAGAVATTGAATLWGVNKVTDAIFD